MTAGHTRLLLLDLGNTRLKACFVRIGPDEAREDVARDTTWEWEETKSVSTGPSLATELESWLASQGECVAATDAAALTFVASHEREQEVREVLRKHIDGPLFAPPDCGMLRDVRHPETIGLDRLFAARGAATRQCSESSVSRWIVVDAGTAVTVDAVLVEDDESAPLRFLGGAIAPGPELLARALADGGARLPLVDIAPGARALGKETTEALQAGVVVGFEGAVQRLVHSIASELSWEQPEVILTGGAAPFLHELADREDWVRDERLVLRGLAHATLEALRMSRAERGS
ncbi:MAG: type III pantothenate kinase [Planctomycetota bacterium]|jgi:type III pantothenate kinase